MNLWTNFINVITKGTSSIIVKIFTNFFDGCILLQVQSTKRVIFELNKCSCFIFPVENAKITTESF